MRGRLPGLAPFSRERKKERAAWTICHSGHPQGRRRLSVFAAALAAILFAGPAAAATAECIPAARFLTLARISEGSMSQFAELLGLPGQPVPDEGCYSVLLSGPIDKGSAASLLAAIERNKGWLAQVYLATWDGDLMEEVVLAQLMRDFALTGVLLDSGDIYAPDFLALPQALPASVSNSWPETEQKIRQPLALAFKDYLESTGRRIQPAAAPCGAGCWTILAGAIERRVRLPVGQKAADRPDAVQSPQAMSLRDAVRARFGAPFSLIKATAGYRPLPGVPRFARFERAPIEADCRSAVEYANAIEGELAKASNAFAAKGFPFMRLEGMLPKYRRFQNAAGMAESCMRRGVARLRMKAFRDLCKETCGAELRKAEEAATVMLGQPPQAAVDSAAPAPPPSPPTVAEPPPPFTPKLRPQRSR